MYSYQHKYHAGSWADLHKHLILICLLNCLLQKNSAFCVLDAFAGEGIYDLKSEESQKNQEYLNGFNRILNTPELAIATKELVSIAQTINTPLSYPGSPFIIYNKLRQQDRGILVENHPQAYVQLKKYFNNKQNINIHKRDAKEAILALIPFQEKRGLVFIDPSYEVKTEYKIISSIIIQAYKKFPQAIYMIWYPLLAANRHLELILTLKNNFYNMWQHEYINNSQDKAGIYGSGVIIINPPWQFDSIIKNDLKNVWWFM